ncbi:hypothetical protein [Puia sp.]|jgi:hypothetical protein|uniref:hypothetical protein n=1 Tax=Puia sp. TaxID=2045100 RepID=UPI002F423FBB
MFAASPTGKGWLNSGFTMQYNVTNDDKDLYVCVSSGDEAAQLRMLRSGMTLYFDPKGEKRSSR